MPFDFHFHSYCHFDSTRTAGAVGRRGSGKVPVENRARTANAAMNPPFDFNSH